MRKKGQGAFEYVLLLGGVLLIVVLAVVLLRGGLFQSGAESTYEQNCKLSLAQAAGCYDGSEWNTTGLVYNTTACVQYFNEASNPPILGLNCDGSFGWETATWKICCGPAP